ncbi:MAG: hypothetical protein ACK5NT_09355 [Pyrinomonadaceae bacterium]
MRSHVCHVCHYRFIVDANYCGNCGTRKQQPVRQTNTTEFQKFSESVLQDIEKYLDFATSNQVGVGGRIFSDQTTKSVDFDSADAFVFEMLENLVVPPWDEINVDPQKATEKQEDKDVYPEHHSHRLGSKTGLC